MAISTQKLLPSTKGSAIVKAKTTSISADKISVSSKKGKTFEIKTKVIEIDKILKGTFTAKKKLEKQIQELKSFINFHYGANSWNEILRMEAEIRKKRQQEIYARQELIRKIWEYIGWGVLFCTIVGFIFVLAWLYKEKRG